MRKTKKPIKLNLSNTVKANNEIKALPVYREFIESNKRFCVLLGGAGSGKSYVSATKVVLRIITQPDVGFLVLRKISRTIKPSVFKDIVDIIDSMGMSSLVKVNKSELKITCIHNKSFIQFMGIDDPEKIKSISGINNIWVEEATEFKEEDIDQLKLRMRAECKSYQQMILSFNPINAKHWIKEKFWDIVDDEVYKLRTTYNDNHFLSEATKKDYEKIKQGTNYYNVYVLANWGSIQNESSLFYNFGDENLYACSYDESKALHVSFDFNRQPYSCCSIYQVDGYNIYNIDELMYSYPATAEGIAKLFLSKYKNHKGVIYVYGDSSGDNNTVVSIKSAFAQVMDLIKAQFNAVEYKVLSKNPSIGLSCSYVNSIFNDEQTYKLYIHKHNYEMIDDLYFLKSDQNGGKLKEMVKNADGVSYEKYGHLSDTLRYFIVSLLYNEYQLFATNNKKLQYTSEQRVSAISDSIGSTSVNYQFDSYQKQSNFR